MLAETRNRAEIELLILKESELSKFKLHYEYIVTFKDILRRLRILK